MVGEAGNKLDAARREAEVAHAKLEVINKQAKSLGRMASSAMASTKRSIDHNMAAQESLGVDNEEHTEIRKRVDDMSPAEIREELSKYPGSRVGGSDTVIKHRLQNLLCGLAVPVDDGDEEDGPTPGEIATDLINEEMAR